MSEILTPKELDLDITNGDLILVPCPNFSYKTIPNGCCMKIYTHQEMLLFNEINIDGVLIIDGDLSFVE
jgi:membrane protease subunit (stomatin/prohibitin family)